MITHLSAFFGGVLITLLLTWRTESVTTPQKQDFKQYRAQAVPDKPSSSERFLRSKTNPSQVNASKAKTDQSKVEKVAPPATKKLAKKQEVDIDSPLTRLINTIPDSLVPRYEGDSIKDEQVTKWVSENLVGKEVVSQMLLSRKLVRRASHPRNSVSRGGIRVPFDLYEVGMPVISKMYFGDDVEPRFWLKDKRLGISLNIFQTVYINNGIQTVPAHLQGLSFADEALADKVAKLLEKEVVDVKYRITTMEVKGRGTGCSVRIEADVIAIDNVPIPDLSDRFVR